MAFWTRREEPDPRQTSPGYYPAAALPYVANVSWPRSGHHLLVRLLQGTFGPLFGYCEHYQPRKAEPSPCCGAFPCRRAGLIHMSKQHDFDLTAHLPEDVPVVVQYRGFVASAISQFEMTTGEGGTPDTAAAFRTFSSAMVPGYRGFMARWVESPRERRVTIAYEDLVADPVTEARKVLDLYGMGAMAPHLRRAAKRVKAATYVDGKEEVQAERGVKDDRDVTQFRHYDPALFDRLTAEAEGR